MDGLTGTTCDRCGARASCTYIHGDLSIDLCAHHAREHDAALVAQRFERYRLVTARAAVSTRRCRPWQPSAALPDTASTHDHHEP